MKPWILLTGIRLLLNIFNILRALFFSLAIMDAIGSILRWVVSAYFFLVVLSFKKEIETKEVEEEGRKGEMANA